MGKRIKYDVSQYRSLAELQYFHALALSSEPYATYIMAKVTSTVIGNSKAEVSARARTVITFDRALNGESVGKYNVE